MLPRCRKKAKKSGEKQYIGSDCRKCGGNLRYTSGGACVACMRSNSLRRYYEDEDYRSRTRQRSRESAPKYREENRERINARRRELRAQDPERYREQKRRYYKENPEQVSRRNAYSSMSDRYRRQVRKTTSKLFPGQQPLVQAVYRLRDQLKAVLGIELHVDHIIPVKGKYRCGLHCYENLRIITASENFSKSNSRVDDDALRCPLFHYTLPDGTEIVIDREEFRAEFEA